MEETNVTRSNAPHEREQVESEPISPSAAILPADGVLKRNLRLSIGDATLYGVMVGGGESYLQAFVLAVGLNEVFAGLVATLPVMVGSLLQLVSPRAVRLLGSSHCANSGASFREAPRGGCCCSRSRCKSASMLPNRSSCCTC